MGVQTGFCKGCLFSRVSVRRALTVINTATVRVFSKN